jgi:hypothetical protein
MRGFVRRYLALVLEREPDIIQAIQQTMARKFINLEAGGKSVLVSDFAILQINRKPIIFMFGCALDQLGDLCLAQYDGEHAIFHAVIRKDVGKRWRNHRAKAEIIKRPDCMLPG